MKHLFLSCLFFAIFTSSIIAQEDMNSAKFVTFEEIEVAPKFEGCTKEDNDDCTTTKLIAFITDSFEESAFSESISEEEKIALIKFFVDSNGKVIHPYVISRNEKFKKTLILILNSLPNFTPGLQQNEPAIVIFEFPINLSIQATIPIFRYDDETLSSFAVLKKCNNKNDSKSCTLRIIQNKIMDGKYSKLKLPKNEPISALVKFVVNENGIVSQIIVEGSHVNFNNEIEKNIGELPKFDPGIKDGKPVQILFQMPIKFMTSN